MTDQKLKACPFCGGMPEIEDCFNITEIRCTGEHCTVHPRTDGSYRAEAIAAWNIRKGEPDEDD